MAQDASLVTTSQYLHESTNWLLALGRGENVAVMFFHKSDRLWRLQQLLEDKEFMRERLGKRAKYMFQIVDFSLTVVEDPTDIQEYIARQLNLAKQSGTSRTFEEWMMYLKTENIRLILVLPEAERYLTPSYERVLSQLTHVSTQYMPHLLVLSFYELDIRHPQFAPKLPKSSHLFEHVYYYPLYEPVDIRHFIDYLERKWDMSVPKKEKDKVMEYCGGHTWLVKEAVREISSIGHWSSESEGMGFRIKSLYSLFLPSELTVTEKIVDGKDNFTRDEERSLEHLQKLNVLTIDGRIAPRLLSEYIKKHADSESELAQIGSKVYLNKVPLERFFSKKEYRVFKLLLENKGNIVSRDQIAATLWPVQTQEQYSDWAIDQVIARLRKRMTSLSLPSQSLTVVRGRGYILELP